VSSESRCRVFATVSIERTFGVTFASSAHCSLSVRTPRRNSGSEINGAAAVYGAKRYIVRFRTYPMASRNASD